MGSQGEGEGKTETYKKTKYGVRIKFPMHSSAFCYYNKPPQITNSQGGESHLAVQLHIKESSKLTMLNVCPSLP